MDAAEWTDTDLAAAVARENARAADRIDLAQGRTLAAVWFDRGAHRTGRLLLRIHHFVVDGVSWRILGPDLRAAVTARAQGHPRPSPRPEPRCAVGPACSPRKRAAPHASRNSTTGSGPSTPPPTSRSA